MDFDSLQLDQPPKSRMMLQRVIAVVAGVAIFSFIASTLRPGSSAASEKATRHHAANLTAGGAGGTGNARRATDAEHFSRLETGGRAAPAHPRGLKPLGNMLGRDYLTWIYASPDGPRFTICRPDGDILAEDLTADEVYAQFPDLDIKGMGTPADAEIGPLMLAPEQP